MTKRFHMLDRFLTLSSFQKFKYTRDQESSWYEKMKFSETGIPWE